MQILHKSKEEILLKKRIIASLLALAVVAAPVTVFANTDVTIPTDRVLEAVNTFSANHVEVINGQAYVPLRAAVESFEGTSVAWNQPTRTVTITINGAAAQAGMNALLGINLDIVPAGNFVLNLQYDPTRIVSGGRLVVVDGPAAGTRINARITDEGRLLLPIAPMPHVNNVLEFAVLAQGIANTTGALSWNLIQAAIAAVMPGFSINLGGITADGINITFGQ